MIFLDGGKITFSVFVVNFGAGKQHYQHSREGLQHPVVRLQKVGITQHQRVYQ